MSIYRVGLQFDLRSLKPRRIETAANLGRLEVSSDLFSVLKTLTSAVLTTTLIARLRSRKQQRDSVDIERRVKPETPPVEVHVQLNCFHMLLLPVENGQFMTSSHHVIYMYIHVCGKYVLSLIFAQP